MEKDHLDYQFATEEEYEEHFEEMIVESFERWFEMPAINFPKREGFEF